MTIEEFYSKFDRVITLMSVQTGLTVDEVKALFNIAWDSGYNFAQKEQELNKGASF